MSPDERKVQGAAINSLKDEATEALAARRLILKSAALEKRLAAEAVDVTLPVRQAGIDSGRIHAISQVTDELVAIFADMGFSIAEGPDIESDDYNFTKLNFPPGHPRAKCTTRSSSRPTRKASVSCCAPIQAPCRCARC